MKDWMDRKDERDREREIDSDKNGIEYSFIYRENGSWEIIILIFFFDHFLKFTR